MFGFWAVSMGTPPLFGPHNVASAVGQKGQGLK